MDAGGPVSSPGQGHNGRRSATPGVRRHAKRASRLQAEASTLQLQDERMRRWITCKRWFKVRICVDGQRTLSVAQRCDCAARVQHDLNLPMHAALVCVAVPHVRGLVISPTTQLCLCWRETRQVLAGNLYDLQRNCSNAHLLPGQPHIPHHHPHLWRPVVLVAPGGHGSLACPRHRIPGRQRVCRGHRELAQEL